MSKLLTVDVIADRYGQIAWFDGHPTVLRGGNKVGRWCLRCTLTDGWNAYTCAPGGLAGGLIVHVFDPDTVEYDTREEADAHGAKYVNRESIAGAVAYHRDKNRQIVTVLDDYTGHQTYGSCAMCNTEALPLILAGMPVPVVDRGDDKLPGLPPRCAHNFRWCPTCTPGWPTVDQWSHTAGGARV